MLKSLGLIMYFAEREVEGFVQKCLLQPKLSQHIQSQLSPFRCKRQFLIFYIVYKVFLSKALRHISGGSAAYI